MFKLKHYSCLLFVGTTQSGKATLIGEMISRKTYDYEFKNIIWCYKVFQKWFMEEKGMEFVQGLPEKFDSESLIITDDLMNDLNEKIADLFTVAEHHSRVSVILIMQIYFAGNRSQD
ncbi:uncharacterized protein NPIL_320261 [Nephila pilipes]|uniref:Uncharacterized protein n=1 Tax=Nephila pilipes TaxID=299642 RepID=A0A8X6TMG5_NEPPI|nr:uncharacterized protein NPIL_320261 [Nephila pilipes]